jgi:eukaryotic-like serine/threonine-protein kinase
VLGPVFRGYDPTRDHAVAIKAISLDLTPEQAREVAADLGRLPTLPLKHPSIVTPIDAGAEGSTAYLVQEYFVAESADVALKQYGPAPVADAMRLIGQLAGALDFAASVGVHHGALHPRDILVAPHEVRLSGLGIVEALERVGFRTPVRRPYAAPERAAGLPAAGPGDVFSLAGVAYELLTGRRPSPSGTSVSVESDVIQSADPAALAEVFARALSPRADDRFPSSLAFAAALKHALTGEPLTAGDAVERPRARRAPRAAGRKESSEPKAGAPVPEAGDSAAESTERAPEPAGGALPLGDVSSTSVVEPGAAPDLAGEPLAAAPAPGSTPLPSFLETYRPLAEPTADATEPLAATELVRESFGGPEAAEIDRRTEMTAAIPLASAPVVRPQADDVAAPARRARPTPAGSEVRPEPMLETPKIRRRRSEPVVMPVPETPVQPALSLDEPLRRDGPPPEPSMLGSEPQAAPPDESRPKGHIVSLIGMLLVGILIGYAAGYFTAPRVAPAAPQPAVTPVASVPAAAPPTSQEAAAAPASAPPSAPGGASAPSPAATTIEASSPVPTKPAASPPAAPPSETSRPARASSPSPVRDIEKPAKAAATPAKKPAAAPAKTAAPPPASTAKPAARAKFEGSLVVASKPEGAAVHLDGREVGKTPMTLPVVMAGAHAVRLELSGYQVWSSSIQVTAGKVTRVTASLDRRPGG